MPEALLFIVSSHPVGLSSAYPILSQISPYFQTVEKLPQINADSLTFVLYELSGE